MRIVTVWSLSLFVLCICAQCPVMTYTGYEVVGEDYMALSSNSNGCKFRCCNYDWCAGYSWTGNASWPGPGRGCIVGENCCYLKSSVTDSPTEHPDKKFYSGVREGSCRIQFKPLLNVSLSGENLDSASISQNECQARCCSNKTCQGYAWTASAVKGGTSKACKVGEKCCYLKSTYNGTVQNNPFYSAVKLPACPEPTFTRFQNIDLPGSDLATIANVDEMTCKSICCSDTKCKAYSHAIKTEALGVNNTCTVGAPCCNLKYDTPFYNYSKIHMGAYRN